MRVRVVPRSHEFPMANKMLIDAAHPEETRVVVLRGSRVEEFDFESENKKQLRGNIYLAKVTRVEPSLQAAFVEYGGNRHGFLAFSEIHPDYYQIPMSDRQALLDAEATEPEEEEERKPRRSRRRRGGERQATAAQRQGDETISEAAGDEGSAEDERQDGSFAGEDDPGPHGGDSSPTESVGQQDDQGSHDAPRSQAHHEVVPSDDPTTALIARAEHAGEGPAGGTEASSSAAPAAAALEQTMAETGRLTDTTPADVAPAETMVLRSASEQQGAGEEAAANEEHAAAANDDAANNDAASNDMVSEVDAAPTSDADVDIGSSEVPAAPASDGDVRGDRSSGDDASRDGSGSRGERPGRGQRGRRGDHEPSRSDSRFSEDEDEEEEEHVEQLGGDAMEEIPVRSYRSRRQYKIQEVIKRRQVLLVQVVKEERGNKGAALTTYLSLAGRYSVLMPNTAKGGGISRKITDAGDRQRLKSIAQDLEVPDGMGVILRTAGASRTKPEVKRDFEYLMRMWETVRETTLKSQAPTLVYEEGSLIKRAIRDLYNKDIEEIVVSGEDAYREAKDFMRLLMPTHSKNVVPWRDTQPIFTKAGAEAQLDAMFSSHVTLKSGGTLVINQTEALVAIDVNSGRSTREHNIEDTALRTNLEAADEVARQLRLRDLAGLIVIDFIDMDESRNNRAVERRIKDALKDDRARIQIGRISHFGLMEMSRQRIRTGVLEGSTVVCEHCAGTGMMRSTSSIALHVLRLLEDALIADASRDVTVLTRGAVGLYILNHKRFHLSELEARFGVAVTFETDEHLTGMSYCTIERGEPASGIVRPMRQIPIYEPELDDAFTEESEDDEAEEAHVAEADGFEADAGPAADGGQVPADDGEGRRKRRRRRGRGRDRESSGISEDAPQPADDALAFVANMDAGPMGTDPEGGAMEGGTTEGGTIGGVMAVRPGSIGEQVGDAETVGAEDGSGADGSGADGRDEPRRRRSRRGGRRAREGRERHIDGAEGSADTQPRFGDEDGAPTEVPLAALGEVATFGEPASTAPSTTGEYAEDHSKDVAARQTIMEPVAEEPVALQPMTTEPGREPVPASIDEVAANVPETAEAPEQAHPPAEPARPASNGSEEGAGEAGAEPDAATPAPRRPEPVSSELDPARPKRSGWWSRAKATLGG